MLYKYLSDANLVISEGYIRGTQISALNDPFEANYCKWSLEQLLREIEVGDIGEYLIKAITERLKGIGVFSVTEVNDNLLMWSHYANQHKGVALKFYFNQQFNFLANPEISKSSITGCPNIFKRVQYRKRPKFRADLFDAEYHYSPTLIDEIAQAVLLQKSEDWIYEQERRLILPLVYADRVIINSDTSTDSQVQRCIELTTELSEESHPSLQLYDKRVDESGKVVHVFYPERVADEEDRHLLSLCLSSLSQNPNAVFLFKLSAGVLNGVILGINHTKNTKDLYFNERISFPMMKGYLQQAKRSEDMYAIDFFDI